MFLRLGTLVARHPVLIIFTWIVLAAGLHGIAPPWDAVTREGNLEYLPPEMTSVRGARLLEAAFPQWRAKSQFVIVVERPDGPLTEDDFHAVDHLASQFDPHDPQLRERLALLDVWTHRTEIVGSKLVSRLGRNGQATLVLLHLGREFMEPDNIDVLDYVQQVIARVRAADDWPAGLRTGVSGSAAIGGDMLGSAKQSIANTETTTILLVLVILLAVYRAPLLVVVPLATILLSVIVATDLVALLTQAAAHVDWLSYKTAKTTRIFIVVILFGAGTDYCLFLIARYKEELQRQANLAGATARSLLGVGDALLASALTTILGLATMYFADFGKFTYAGPTIALALSIALLACLTLAPALLRLLGPVVFWPFGTSGLAKQPTAGNPTTSPTTNPTGQPAAQPAEPTPPDAGVAANAGVTADVGVAGDVRVAANAGVPGLSADAADGVAGSGPSGSGPSPGQPRAPRGWNFEAASYAFWTRMAGWVLARPGLVLAAAALLMVYPAWHGLRVPMSYNLLKDLQEDRPSVRGTELVARHFPLGEVSPITVVAFVPDGGLDTDAGERHIARLTKMLYDMPGISAVRSYAEPLGDPPGFLNPFRRRGQEKIAAKRNPRTKAMYLSQVPRYRGKVTRLDLIIDSDPFSEQSVALLDRVDLALRQLAATPQGPWYRAEFDFAGTTAGRRDLQAVVESDQTLIQRLVVLTVFAVLVLILRRPLLCAYLILTVVASYLVTIGITQWVFAHYYGQSFDGLDWKVPIFLFVILVAVGEDYNIYLVTRVLEEQRRRGPFEGLRVALVRTGGIITGCGVIMAGTFCSMMSGTLRGMLELGFALALGVLLDTFFVRPVLVPTFMAWLLRFGGGAGPRPTTAVSHSETGADVEKAPPADQSPASADQPLAPPAEPVAHRR